MTDEVKDQNPEQPEAAAEAPAAEAPAAEAPAAEAPVAEAPVAEAPAAEAVAEEGTPKPKAKVKGGAKGGASAEGAATAEPKATVAAAAAAQVRQSRAGGGPGAEVKAIAKWVRMSPRKARRAIDLIRGKQVDEARLILSFLNLRAARTVLKVLDSAVANAEHNKGLNRRELSVKKAFVDGGPVLKRFQPHAQGRAFPIKKRTSHITVVVGK